jgi:DNA-binding TFAR19-related protein (PDSD5 family)
MPEQYDEEYEKRARKRLEATVRKMQDDQQKRELARRLLDDKAYERLMNIKASNEELYEQILGLLISLVQSQRVAGKISEKDLVAILEKVTARHEPTISFRHK